MIPFRFSPFHPSLSHSSTNTFLSCAQPQDCRESPAGGWFEQTPRDGWAPANAPQHRSHAALSSATSRGDLLQSSFLLPSIPAPFPAAQAWQSFIKASLSSLCFGDIVLWISPPRSTFVQTIGENAEIFILKNKSTRSSTHRQREWRTNYTP